MRPLVGKALALAALAVAGCGPLAQRPPAGPASSGDSRTVAAPTTVPASPAPAPTASTGRDPLQPPSTPTPGPAVGADLVLAGALVGHVRTGRPEGTCGAGPGGFSFGLSFTLDGQGYVLGVDVLDYRGPGVYPIPPERVSIRSETPQGAPSFLPATAGSVTVNPDESSGKLDAKLGGQGQGQVSGSFTCR